MFEPDLADGNYRLHPFGSDGPDSLMRPLMASTSAQIHPLVELEQRQDEALRQLEALELRIETALAEFTALRLEALKPTRAVPPAAAA